MSDKSVLKIVISMAAAVVAISIILAVALGGGKSCRQQLDYTESLEKINNPDQGFYRPVYVRVTEDGAAFNKNIINDTTQLYHLRGDISAFSKEVNGDADKPLTDGALDGIKSVLDLLKERQKNAVVRFCYDPSYNGAKDKEPRPDIILRHIEQLCTVLNGYETTVTAIEAGLVGPWGEMHSSAIANKENITPIIDKLLSCTQNLPVLVRTPKMIYNYLGITEAEAENFVIPKESKAYRLGIFNDGYLGSSSDLGTYTNRGRDISFLANQTGHLPYGGEVVVPSSDLHDIDKCTPEMFKINLSYLNIEWHYDVIDKWKSSTYSAACGDDALYYGRSAFTYIENRMGYRFVVRDSTFKYKSGKAPLEIRLNIENVGFGNMTKEKKAKLIFTDGDNKAVKEAEVGCFTGAGEITYKATPALENGEYSVYLCVYGGEDCSYPVRFANGGMWNGDLNANYIGKVIYK